jgi:peptidoglycan L-alanyl-D-glutamate endopeptidase CwlK
MARDITKLHPKVKELAEAVAIQMALEGVPFKITECVRTEKEQNNKYRDGYSKQKYPNSFHCWGLAFDMIHNVKGDIGNKRVLKKAADIVKAEGLKRGLDVEWGGDWKSFPDAYHIQINDFGTTKQLTKKYKTPEAFFSSWNEETKQRSDVVILVEGAKYTNGISVPKKYIGVPLTVEAAKGDRILISEICSWVLSKYAKKQNAMSKRVLITANALNIREGAGTGHKIVGLAKKGEEYTITETAKVGAMTWGKCSKGWFGLTGYTKTIG